jgi:hypothetical protein
VLKYSLTKERHMELHVEPRASHRAEKPRYFVRSLKPDDQEYARGCRWQVQFLDDEERAAACLSFGAADTAFHMVGLDLPRAVIEAAMSGMSDYVDSAGRRRLPAFLGGGSA